MSGGLLLVLLGSAALMAGAPAASAHAELESTDPSQSSVLVVPPRQVVLHFGEPVEIDFGSIRVLAPDGSRVDEGGTHHPGGDGSAVAIALPPRLPPGTYVVAWRVISDDSHPVHGAFVFSVGTIAGAGKARTVASALSAAKGSTAVGAVYGVVRFAVFAGLLVLVGLGAVVTLVCPPAARLRRVRRVLWGAWAVLLVAGLAGFAVQGVYAAALPLTHIASPSLWHQVANTRFGEVQLLRTLLLIALLPVLARFGGTAGRRSSWMLVPGAGLCLGLLVTPGLAGHAAATGNPVVGEVLDVLHLAGASIWLGGLVLLVALALPGVPVADAPVDLPAVARRFSVYAVGAVLVLTVTGVVQSVRQVGSRYALLDTVYGRTLMVKVGIVALLVVLGASSRRRVSGRRTAADEPAGRLRRGLVTELAVGAAVLVVTALLVNAVPARQAASQPFTQSFEVLGVQVNAVVAPARVGGGNQFHFYVLGPLGRPKAIPELDASIDLPSAHVGPLVVPLEVASPGHYQASRVDIPFAGAWVLTVTVRTSPTDERQVHAVLAVH